MKTLDEGIGFRCKGEKRSGLWLRSEMESLDEGIGSGNKMVIQK